MGSSGLTFARLKPYFYIVGVGVALLLLWNEVNRNWFDLQALRWHVKHGSKVRCCGIEMDVPLKYSQDDVGWGISLANMPGHFRSFYFHSPFSLISVNPRQHAQRSYTESEKQEGMDRLIALQERYGFKFVTSSAIEVAGTHLQCYEFSCPSPLGPKYDQILGPQLKVTCLGDEFNVSFLGGSALRDEFYSMVKTARATPN
jgi:hypothetical protein